MLDRFAGSMITVAIAAAAVGAVVSMSITRTSGQAQVTRPARVEGKPNFSGQRRWNKSTPRFAWRALM